MRAYEDILDRERPVHEGDAFSQRHPRMPLEERAKIFLPFAALKGFEEDEMGQLDLKLHEAMKKLREGREVRVRVRYFRPVGEDGRGVTEEREGRLSRVDESGRCLIMEDIRIPFRMIREMGET